RRIRGYCCPRLVQSPFAPRKGVLSRSESRRSSQSIHVSKIQSPEQGLYHLCPAGETFFVGNRLAAGHERGDCLFFGIGRQTAQGEPECLVNAGRIGQRIPRQQPLGSELALLEDPRVVQQIQRLRGDAADVAAAGHQARVRPVKGQHHLRDGVQQQRPVDRPPVAVVLAVVVRRQFLRQRLAPQLVVEAAPD